MNFIHRLRTKRYKEELERTNHSFSARKAFVQKMRSQLKAMNFENLDYSDIIQQLDDIYGQAIDDGDIMLEAMCNCILHVDACRTSPHDRQCRKIIKNWCKNSNLECIQNSYKDSDYISENSKKSRKAKSTDLTIKSNKVKCIINCKYINDTGGSQDDESGDPIIHILEYYNNTPDTLLIIYGGTYFTKDKEDEMKQYVKNKNIILLRIDNPDKKEDIQKIENTLNNIFEITYE